MSDLIKRVDAIRAIHREARIAGGSVAIEYADMFQDAIKALPSADRPQGEVDAIDRDALIDYCLKLIDVERKQGSDVMNYGQERVNQTEAIIDYIEHMPHVNGDRPQGEWIDAEIPLESGGSMPIQVCNLCKTFYPLAYTGGGHRFCPNCGARMKGASDVGVLSEL